MTRPVALTIAGSDSGGGAGIQADLRVFSRLGTFGTTAVTAVTAQNLTGVHAVEDLSPQIVEAQIRAVLDGFEVHGAKTGMLWSAAVVERVAALMAEADVPLVVDPVMVAGTGDPLLQRDALDAHRERLIPVCTLLTPNLQEAALLLDERDIERDDMELAAATLGRQFGCAVLLKGGHLAGDPLDVLWEGDRYHRWEHPRLTSVNTHGTGCMLSAAIAAHLAAGVTLAGACDEAMSFLQRALAEPHVLRDAKLAGVEGV